MQNIGKLVERLSTLVGAPIFVVSDDFHWSPAENTIHYRPDHPYAEVLLLHEYGHSLLGHSGYTRDIELLGMERQAWDKARELAQQFEIQIDDDIVQDSLDTYRDWLHARASCPSCGTIGLESKKQLYTCPHCHGTWKVNEARSCALRRYKQ